MSCLARPGEAWAPAGQDIVSQGIVYRSWARDNFFAS